MPASQRIHGRKKHLLLGSLERRGAGFCRGAPLPYRSLGVLEKKISNFLEDSEFVWYGCDHGATGGVFCDATNQEIPKSSCAKLRYRPGTGMDCK